MSLWLLGSKLRLVETISERKSVSQICVQEKFHTIKVDENLS